MTYKPRLITPCVVTYDTVVVDFRSRWQKLKDAFTATTHEDAHTEFCGRSRMSECVIHFGPCAPELGTKIKEPIVFEHDHFDVVETTYYGVIPLSIDSDGNHVCVVDHYSTRNILIDDSGEEP